MNQIHKRVLVQIGAQKFSSLHISGVGAHDLPCLTRSYIRWYILWGSYKTWTGLWTGFWTGLWNACELSFKLVEMQVEMLKTAVV